MKKRLKWIIPLCIALAIAAFIGILALRYRASGAVLLSGLGSDGLIQIREKGFRRIELQENDHMQDPAISPNGRYVVFFSTKDSTCTLYDLQAPGKPLFSSTGKYYEAAATNDGRMLLLNKDRQLYLCDGQTERLLDAQVHSKGQLTRDGLRFYYFHKNGEQYDLCRLDLKGGTPEVLLENAAPEFLQLSQDEQGRDLVCAARRQIREATRYDLVTDKLAEADAGSRDEAAIARNKLRQQLKTEPVRREVWTIFRMENGTWQTLADGVYRDFFCDVRTGQVVCCVSALYAPQMDLKDIIGARIPTTARWYCFNGETRFELEPLRMIDNPTSVTFTERGPAIMVGKELLCWDGPVCTERIDRVSGFCTFRNTAGEEEVYYLTHENDLFRCTPTGPERISQGVHNMYIPCRTLPDGSRQAIDNRVYLLKYYDETMQNPHTSEVSLSRVSYPPMVLYLLQDGVQTPILKINDGFSPLACLEDGTLIAHAGGMLWVLNENRSDRLTTTGLGVRWLVPTCVVDMY